MPFIQFGEISSAFLSLVAKGKVLIESDSKLYVNDTKEEKVSKDLINSPRIIGKVYLHVSNSGVRFSVEDRGFDPAICIRSSFFGNGVCTFETCTNKQSLKALAKLFLKASEETYSKEYFNKASIY